MVNPLFKSFDVDTSLPTTFALHLPHLLRIIMISVENGTLILHRILAFSAL